MEDYGIEKWGRGKEKQSNEEFRPSMITILGRYLMVYSHFPGSWGECFEHFLSWKKI